MKHSFSRVFLGTRGAVVLLIPPPTRGTPSPHLAQQLLFANRFCCCALVPLLWSIIGFAGCGSRRTMASALNASISFVKETLIMVAGISRD